MARIFAVMVVRNEADRYLYSVLNNLVDQVDDIFVYDDRSLDETVQLAKLFTRHVVVRPELVPSFVQHEGHFREAGWHAFEGLMQPRDGDWVLAIDADEFLVSELPVRDAIQQHIDRAATEMAVLLPIPEVFGWDDRPLVRKDGFWATIQAPRLFRYQPDGVFDDRAAGCGSQPTYVAQGMWLNAEKMWLLHYGYARKDDQQKKYDRFTGLAAHGHNARHVESILQTPVLEAWTGPEPTI